MIKKNLLAFLLICSVFVSFAQEEEEEKKGFRKENMFTGGSISLSFFNSTFLIGANPVLGYRVAGWLDGGIVVNYQYSTSKDPNYGDKLNQSFYGGGVFTRIYPIHFLFGTAQFEHNFLHYKYIYANGGPVNENHTSGNSMLVGGGYASGRQADGNTPFSICVCYLIFQETQIHLIPINLENQFPLFAQDSISLCFRVIKEGEEDINRLHLPVVIKTILPECPQ